MDTYLYPESNYMSRWTKRVMKEYPNLNITGEVWFDQPDILSYWQRGKKNMDDYVSHLPSLFDFPLQVNLIKALSTAEDWDNGWIDLYETLARDFQYPDPNNLVTFVDNHDMSRAYAQLDHDVVKLKTALAYIMTIRGIPQVYYGTELLMDSPKTRDDGMVRADMPGGWTGDTTNAFTGAGLSTEQLEMQAFVRKLLNWRKTATVVHLGKTQHFVPAEGVYVLFRYTDTAKLMVVLNKNKAPYSLKLDRFAQMIGESQEAKNVMTEELIQLGQTINLPGPGPFIFELK
jgi:glycosidase